MTVLYVLISTDPFGGATKSFLLLLQGVLKSGVKAIVVVPDANGIYDTLCGMGVKVIVVSSKGNTWTGARTLKHKILYVPRQLGRVVVNNLAHRKIEKLLRDEIIDIIHSNNTVTDLGRHLAECRKIPHLYHVREYGDKDFGLRYFPTNRSFHKYLNTSNVYTVCITKDIQKHHGLLNNPNSRVIYNGIIDCFSDDNLKLDGRDILLYAGRIEPTKGLLDLVQAYAIYLGQVERPLPLVVAGEVFDVCYKKKVDDFIYNNKLNDYISFIGKCSDMPALYKKAKAIVISSEFEGFGRCMPEAMSYGCIVIGHDTGGTKEQFDNGLTLTGRDIGFRYNDSEKLVNSLLGVHNLQGEDYVSMQHLAFDVVRRMYSVDNYVESILNFYCLIKERQEI